MKSKYVGILGKYLETICENWDIKTTLLRLFHIMCSLEEIFRKVELFSQNLQIYKYRGTLLGEILLFTCTREKQFRSYLQTCPLRDLKPKL